MSRWGGGVGFKLVGYAVGNKIQSYLPPTQAIPGITKSKQRSLEVVSECELPIYNAGERFGPPPRSYSTARNYLPICRGFTSVKLQIDTAFSPRHRRGVPRKIAGFTGVFCGKQYRGNR